MQICRFHVNSCRVNRGSCGTQGPLLLLHHLFKSSEQKPGDRAKWLVKYARVGPLQWHNDCSITPTGARGCVAISCQHRGSVQDGYSWGTGPAGEARLRKWWSAEGMYWSHGRGSRED
jgi:hypothetical protein